MTKINDDWSYIGADESVGIFGEDFVHETCSAWDDPGFDGGDVNEKVSTLRKDGDKVIETVRVVCNDCGAELTYDETYPASYFEEN